MLLTLVTEVGFLFRTALGPKTRASLASLEPLQLEDHLLNKVIVFAWQKQTVPTRRKKGSLIMSVGQNFDEIALFSMVFEIQAFLCFAFLKKFKMAAIFWRVKYSLKLGTAGLHRYPVGQKFCRIRSIWNGFPDTSIFVFCNFC